MGQGTKFSMKVRLDVLIKSGYNTIAKIPVEPQNPNFLCVYHIKYTNAKKCSYFEKGRGNHIQVY